MAFPIVSTRITGRTNNTNTTSHAITMPAGIVAGNLLLVVFSVDGNPTVTAQQAGWTKLNQASNGTVVTGAIFYKVATGGDALTLTTSVAEASSHVSFRIASGGIPTATSAVATGTNTDPPAHTPPGGTKDFLWIATRSADSTNVASAAPASFTNLQTQVAQGNNGASTNTAERSLNAATQNPATFTSTSIGWVAWTVAVPPVTQTAAVVAVASTAAVALPSVITRQTLSPVVVAATASVELPKVVVPLHPVALAGSAQVFLPQATVAQNQSVLPEPISSTSLVREPSAVAGGVTVSPALVATAGTVGEPTFNTHQLLLVPSTATVASPALALITRLDTIGPGSGVPAPTVRNTVYPVAIPGLPSTGITLYPRTDLYPSTGLYPFKAQVPHPATLVSIQLAPSAISAGSTVFTPTVSGATPVPLQFPTIVTNASVIETPTLWVETLTVELELVDTEEDSLPPVLILPGEFLLRTEHLTGSAVVPPPEIFVHRATFHMGLVSAASTVSAPLLGIPQLRTLQTISSQALIGQPLVLHEDDYSSMISVGTPFVINAFRAGVPVNT